MNPKQLFQNILTHKAELDCSQQRRKEVNDDFNFLSQNDASFKKVIKMPLVDGKMAYSIDGGQGIAKYSNGGWAVNDRFVRDEEWMPRKWTEEEKKEYWNARKIDSERVHAHNQKVVKALNVRQSLRKSFLR